MATCLLAEGVELHPSLPVVVAPAAPSANWTVELVRLRDENERLRDRLKAALSIPVKCAPLSFHSPEMDGIYTMLYRAWSRDPKGYVARERMLVAVYDSPPTSNAMDVAIFKLRRKLPAGQSVATVWGRGWRLVIEELAQ